MPPLFYALCQALLDSSPTAAGGARARPARRHSPPRRTRARAATPLVPRLPKRTVSAPPFPLAKDTPAASAWPKAVRTQGRPRASVTRCTTPIPFADRRDGGARDAERKRRNGTEVLKRALLFGRSTASPRRASEPRSAMRALRNAPSLCRNALLSTRPRFAASRRANEIETRDSRQGA